MGWIKREMKELWKVEEGLGELVVRGGRMVLSDESREEVRV